MHTIDAREVRRRFPLWRTVEVGRHTTAEAFLRVLDSQKVSMLSYVSPTRSVLGGIRCSETLATVELAEVTGRAVGIEGNYSTDELLEAVLRAGLQKCDLEIAAALAEQFTEQPLYDDRMIGTDPIHLGNDLFANLCLQHWKPRGWDTGQRRLFAHINLRHKLRWNTHAITWAVVLPPLP